MPPRSIDWFAFGGVTCDFEPAEFSPILMELIARVPDIAPSILHIAYMSVFRKPERLPGFRDLFKQLVVMQDVIEKLRQPDVGHSWQVIVDELLRDPPDNLIRSLADLVIVDSEKQIYFSLRGAPVTTLATKLLERYAKVAWPVFAGHLRVENGDLNFSLVDLLCRRGIMDESGVPLWDQDEAAFRAWAASNPDILPHLVGKMPLYCVGKRPAGEQVGTSEVTAPALDDWGDDEELISNPAPDECHVWHPLAACVLDLCGHRSLVDAISSNLFTFSSTGSSVPYLQTRLNLVRDLERVGHPGLRAVARAIVPMLEGEIARERKIDAQRAAGIHEW